MRVLMLLVIGLFFQACQNADGETSDIVTVEKYYAALNEQNVKAVPNLLSDSLSVGESGYWSTYSKADYSNWLKWDAQFKPTYQILDIQMNKGLKLRYRNLVPGSCFSTKHQLLVKSVFC